MYNEKKKIITKPSAADMQTVLSRLSILSILNIWRVINLTIWKITREEEYEITREEETRKYRRNNRRNLHAFPVDFNMTDLL